MLFDVIPFPQWLFIAGAGLALGWAPRWLLHSAGLKRDGQVENRYERFTFLVGTLTQSVAVGFALTLLAALLAASQTGDARLLRAVTFGTAAVTSFLAAFLRELIRRLFYTNL
jgi:hypothetical protein